ncbi:MAG: tryptophan--tRNA ligase, partial [Actinomycetia bacterium]|nr:tryptophan--tRNA ligase [Actinomycetes bacterium]
MKRVLTGYRPTGKLHLGHMVGNLQNMLDLQSTYDCYFFIADWHALTTDYAKTGQLGNYIEEMVLDWLAFGLDPEKCTIYRQSDVPEVAELALYLGMLTPLSWLERNPTYKEQLVELKNKEIATYGFIGYPVLQAADILIVHGEVVPVGEDQLPHLELSREIARRFNYLYGDYLTEPQAKLSIGKRVPGTDNRKMSKSYNNAIFLTDSPDEISKKVRKMVTDPARIRRDDPGHPDVCSVFALHKIFTPAEVERIA